MERYNFTEDTVLQTNLLVGEASAQEVAALAQWRAENAENNSYWLTLEQEMKFENAALVGLEVDSKEGWNKVQASIAQAERNYAATHAKLRSPILTKKIMAYCAMAAAMVGIIFLSINLLTPKDVLGIQIATKKNEVKQIMLADGSEVTINGASKFIHPAEFGTNQRVVTLVGEAFFKVSKNKEKPFIVKTNGLEVKVVGTQFNVKDFAENSKSIQVTVLEGIVEVSTTKESHERVRLTKGECVVLNTQAHSFTKTNHADLNEISWKTKAFVFNNTELADVFATLSEAYKVDLRIKNNAILDQQLTANFENRDIDFIMKTISSTFNFSYSIENGVVTIN